MELLSLEIKCAGNVNVPTSPYFYCILSEKHRCRSRPFSVREEVVPAVLKIWMEE
jgi:hypothetical protein